MDSVFGSCIVSSKPQKRPVSLAAVKRQLSFLDDENEFDVQLEEYVDSSSGTLEQRMQRSFITQTRVLKLHSFPEKIKLVYPPVQSVTSIMYLDSEGQIQTLSTDVYSVDTSREPGVVFLNKDQSWPDTLDIDNAVTVTYVTGYGDDHESVPDPIKIALKMHVHDNYENRGDRSVGAGMTNINQQEIDRLTLENRVYGGFKYDGVRQAYQS